MKSKALEDYYAILTAGGRNSGEKSRALPQRAYGDPANNVEFPAETARQEKARRLKQQKKQANHKYRGK